LPGPLFLPENSIGCCKRKRKAAGQCKTVLLIQDITCLKITVRSASRYIESKERIKYQTAESSP